MNIAGVIGNQTFLTGDEVRLTATIKNGNGSKKTLSLLGVVLGFPIKDEGRVVSLLSDDLIPFKHDGIFPIKDISASIEKTAKTAIPFHTDNKFSIHQHVQTIRSHREGQIVAALNKVVVVMNEEGFFAGIANEYEAV